MSLNIKNETTNPVLPKPQAIGALKQRIDMLGQKTYRELCTSQKGTMNEIWHNPSLTPQEAVDVFGKGAVSMFSAHGKLTKLIVDIATEAKITPDILVPTHEFTANPDGTVTIGAKL
jgi:hypothetical protein